MWQKIKCAFGFHTPDPEHDKNNLSARVFQCKYCKKWIMIMYGAY